MNGPAHYREAERFLQHSKDHTDSGNEADRHIAEVAAAQAQVHATLALAAATAAAQATAYDGDEYATRSRGWAGVA